MASQPRLVSQHRDPGQAAVASGWRVWLMRVLAVAAATGVVVVVWSTQDNEPRIAQGTILAPVPEVSTTPLQSNPILAVPEPSTLSPNALPRPPEPGEPARPDGFERFVVQRGDTLYAISVVYGVSIDDLLRFNPDLGNGSHIDVGQLVMVPIFEP